MSLILDALRKSEAERRRGQAPDLFASLPTPSAPSRGGRSRYWAALGLGLLFVGAGFVLWRGRAPEPATVAGAQHQVAATATTTPSRAESAPTAPAASPAPNPASPGAATASVSPAPDQVAAREAAPPAAADAPAPAPAAAPSAPAVRGSSPAPPATVAPASTPVPLPALAANPAPAASADSATAATAAPGLADSADSLPPIAVLGASERAALPPLKLSMHVWNSEPGKRFAIIDGHRLTEGSSAGTSVIEEIRRDGVVLNINGRRVLLPRP